MTDVAISDPGDDATPAPGPEHVPSDTIDELARGAFPAPVDDPASAERAVESLRRQIVGEPELETIGEPPSPAPDSEPGPGSPHVFSDRASFLAVRDAFVDTMTERLGNDDELARRITAELYAAAIETRLALIDLDTAITASKHFFEEGPGRFFGGRGKRTKGAPDGEG
jgi:hypothetical protein